MAQSSAGIKLFYGTGTTSAPPASASGWTEIPDVTAIPALGGEPNMLDVTPLSETSQKQYIAGLKDNGGSMSYTVLLTTAMLTATAAASSTTNADKRWFKVEFPAPLGGQYGMYFYYKGTGVPVLPGEAEVDAALTTTFYTTLESAVGSVVKTS